MSEFYDFCRDFFGTTRRPIYTESSWSSGPIVFGSYQEEIVKKALELAGKCHPATNLMPYLQIAAEAKRLGLEIRRAAEQLAIGGSG